MKRLKNFAVVLLLLLSAGLFAESTPIEGLHFFKLDNGLEVFVLENHSLPLTRIQITFRCGAYTQEPETAGLFHFYEHLLFKGNSKYADEKKFSGAMSDLGVSSWNGGTNQEYVTYFFTVPSAKTDEGIAFWSYAVKEPLFDPEQLELEKKVVINEISGDLANPARPLWAAIQRHLCPKYPWRRDVIGNPDIINSATPELMRKIQHTYYVPNNAAIFIAGDVKPAEALKYVKTHFGDWEKAPDLPKQDPQLMPAQKEPVYLVFPDNRFPEGMAEVDIELRGPDALRDMEYTYAADVWGSLIEPPTSKFRFNMVDRVPEIFDKTEIGAGYYTQRDAGEITSWNVVSGGEKSIVQVAKDIQKAFLEETKAIIADKNYFAPEEYELVKQKLEDDQIWALENPSNFIDSQLSFWWAASSAQYYFGYIDNMKKTTKADIDKFLTDYVVNNVPFIVVMINPNDYKKEKANFKKAGFQEVTFDNAFWWQKGVRK